MDLPRYVQIEPVGQCNLRCQMCPIQFRQDGPPHGPPAFMDFAVFTRLIDGFPTLAELHLQGLGEPLMHPRFFDMVAYAAGKGIRVSTNTNLTLLTTTKAERCVRSGLARLHVSMDGARPETYERIRVRARHARVVANLAKLVAAKERLGAALPAVQLVVVAMRQNLDEIPALVGLAREWGVEEVFVQHLCHDFTEDGLPAHYAPMREFVDQQTLACEDAAHVEEVFAEARARARALGITLRLPPLQPKAHAPGTPGRQRCDWPWRGAYVSYDGRAMPCCMIATPDRTNFGSMAEQGVADVWNGDAYEDFRRRLDQGPPPAVCQACSLYAGTF